jgi:3-oxoacyl-[acyl-carrier protein] reductase
MNILITGASRGIGAAALTHAAIERPHGRRPFHRGGDGLIAADLADPPRRAAVGAALDQLGGRIDVLVNNAGIFEASPTTRPDDEWHAAWARTLTVNLQAAADLCRLAVAHFRDNGGGRIVNVASRAAYRGDSPSSTGIMPRPRRA